MLLSSLKLSGTRQAIGEDCGYSASQAIGAAAKQRDARIMGGKISGWTDAMHFWLSR